MPNFRFPKFRKFGNLTFLLVLNSYYRDEPSPEYAPKKKSVNKPKAARPPIVATIQRGIRPISLISIIIKD